MNCEPPNHHERSGARGARGVRRGDAVNVTDLMNAYVKPNRGALDEVLDEFMAADDSDPGELLRLAFEVKAEMRRTTAPTN
jgi:hypothetical protein